MIPRRLVKLLRRERAQPPDVIGPLLPRIEMTCACRDSDAIPKVPGAGEVLVRDGVRLQRMHQGVMVLADGYQGPWMTELITRLRGHHEPQEELLFHHVVRHCRPGSRMVEIGAFWAYYTAWFLSAVPGSAAVCLEPDPGNAACGRRNLELNALSATWVSGAAGRTFLAEAPFKRPAGGGAIPLPVHNLASLLSAAGHGPVEVLHIDAQGAELPFLESLADPSVRGVVRFLVVSTHDQQISGSPSTHEDCLRVIVQLGGTVLAEHSVQESFSGDGLIVASLDPADEGLVLPELSRNTAGASLFGYPPAPGGEVQLARTHLGPMLVREHDRVIGQHLRAHGHWEELQVHEVVRFLRRHHAFVSDTFVDIGANIGTGLLCALRRGMFRTGVGVEMDPANFRLLQANAALNLEGVQPLLLNVALGDASGEAVMELSPDNLGDHRVRRETDVPPAGVFGEESRRLVRVPMTTLDRIEQDHGLRFDRSTLLWIDTQGYEGHVLAGATGIMSRPADRRPMVVCELWPYGIERAGGKDRLFEFLAGCTSIYNIRAPRWCTAPPAPLGMSEVNALYDRLLSDRQYGEPLFADLLCVP